jgi:hypothetical protein
MGLLGILAGLSLLIWLHFRGWSVLLLAPAAALFGGEPLLVSWTQIFMGNAARFLAQFFPLFLLGAVFDKCPGIAPRDACGRARGRACDRFVFVPFTSDKTAGHGPKKRSTQAERNGRPGISPFSPLHLHSFATRDPWVTVRQCPFWGA